MTYPSVDALQKALGETVFSNRTDIKKAAGRALGTIVEIITFYMLKQWNFLPNLSIERGLAEFGNDQITHNVEFGLHHCFDINSKTIANSDYSLPLTTPKLRKLFGVKNDFIPKSNVLLTKDLILRNSCVIGANESRLLIAHLENYDFTDTKIFTTELKSIPFAMVECKRVGVEDGAKKGPTTIEKAKQGAYVAKHVSSLQKVRGHDGIMYGAWPLKNGGFEIKDLVKERKRLIYQASASELDGFILTVGLVSNHGNWFTKDNMNKELLVLKDSYDWLLFLTDLGIAEFVYETILSEDDCMEAVKKSFSLSYASGEAGKNQFTKVKIDYKADQVLKKYFATNQKRIEKNWFNILTPDNHSIKELKEDLQSLVDKKNEK
ncbi:MAG: hypothetical protein DWI15_01260 [Planctomycetota bacterium]|nr:MAG: hypothetical protein DWI15_01260 [Planctomycetota bacterium]